MNKITKIVVAAAVFGVVGVTALPIASYAVSPSSDDEVVEVEVGDNFSLACNTPVHKVVFPGGTAAADITTMAGSCTVTSNDSDGYVLTAKSTGTAELTSSAGDKITSSAGAPSTAAAKWAIWIAQGATGPSAGSSWLAVPASSTAAITVATTSDVAGPSGDVYPYIFGVSIVANTPAGEYEDTVRFTATAN